MLLLVPQLTITLSGSDKNSINQDTTLHTFQHTICKVKISLDIIEMYDRFYTSNHTLSKVSSTCRKQRKPRFSKSSFGTRKQFYVATRTSLSIQLYSS